MEINPKIFEEHLYQLGASAPILVAVSGGVDSMVLLHLINYLSIPYSVVHCNFQLRGESSDLDEQLVVNQCQINKVKCHTKKFSTLEYATQHHLPIQVAARNLRYQWFEELIATTSAKHLLMAHHLDDQLETVLWHLSRGTGLKGLLGIPEQRGPFLRPLLRYTKEEIKNYALQNRVTYREDLSNQEDKYRRNFIRHRLVPPFKQLNENWSGTLERTLKQLHGAAKMQYWAIQEWSKYVTEPLESDMVLHWNRQKLSESPSPFALLVDALVPLGFNTFQVNEILSHPLSAYGQKWMSNSYHLYLLKESLVILHNLPGEKEVFWHDLNEPLVFIKGIIERSSDPISKNNNKNLEFFDLDKLQFPLVLRSWREGDYFYPIGMGGGKQKLKKFFNNEKIPVYAKKEVPLLVNGDGHIIWVVGYRIDERFKITNQTKNSICLVYQTNHHP